MLYLDNDVLAKYARPDPDPNVVHYLKQHSSEPWGISTIVAYEFLSYYEQSDSNGNCTSYNNTWLTRSRPSTHKPLLRQRT